MSIDLENSSSWEKVSILPHEVTLIELEQKKKEKKDCLGLVQKNSEGIDLNHNNEQCDSSLTVEVVQCTHITENDYFPSISNPYVALSLTPTRYLEKTCIPFHKTSTKWNTLQPKWNESVVFQGIKSKKVKLKITLKGEESNVADVFLGETTVSLSDLVHQDKIDISAKLQRPQLSRKSTNNSITTINGTTLSSNSKKEASSTKDALSTKEVYGLIHLRLQFRFDKLECLTKEIQLLEEKYLNLVKQHEIFLKMSKDINPTQIHPASFGKHVNQLHLTLPGHHFNQELHHPSSVVPIPIPDKAHVQTCYGNGIVDSYRPLDRMYCVRLWTGSHTLAKSSKTLAYLQAHLVKEKPHDDLHTISVGSNVNTPYGQGDILSIERGDILEVKLAFGIGYLNKDCVELKDKKIKDMTNLQKIEKAAELRLAGNGFYKKNSHTEAVSHYLQALGFLQSVDQENATRKEKAMTVQHMVPCHLNIAASKLKLESYGEVVIASSNAMNLLKVLFEHRTGSVVEWMGKLGISSTQIFCDWPSKALFRRSQAFVKLDDYASAKSDLTKAVALAPNDKEIRALLEKVKKRIAVQNKKEKKTWGGIFDKKVENNLPLKDEETLDENEKEDNHPLTTTPTTFQWTNSHKVIALTTSAIVATATIMLLRRNRS